MDPDQFREAVKAAAEDNRPVVSGVQPGYLRDLIPQNAPEHGETWDSIREDLALKIMPGVTHWSSPNFFAFFPAGTSYPSIMGEMYSAALTGSMFNWICSPAATELEEIVMEWLANLMALPSGLHPSAGGKAEILGSASECILTVMIAARDRVLASSNVDRNSLVVIGSETTHSSTQKAAKLLNVHFCPVRARRQHGLRMSRSELEHTIEYCRRQGLRPFFLTATFGTTGTCAVDDFEGISDVLRRNPDIWGHVDAAYAGSALICEEHREIIPHLSSFESFNVNISKWLLVNLEGSCLFVADRSQLKVSLSSDASYLSNESANKPQENAEAEEPRDFQIGLSRRFSSLKVWFVLRAYGAEGLKAHVRKHIALGERFAKLVNERPDLLEVITGPAFALTTVRIKAWPAEGDDTLLQYEAECDRLTKTACSLINQRRMIYVTGCELDGMYVIRFVGANYSTSVESIDEAFRILVSTTEELRESTRKARLSSTAEELKDSTAEARH